MKKGIAALILLAAVPFFVLGYISPGRPSGFVNDFAQILAPEEKTALETVLSNYAKETGNEIAVVTIQTLGDEVVETYAVKLFEEWKIGKEGKDNGLLMLFAMDERKMRIEVGYGLEGDITDAEADRIIRHILTPAFREGNYGSGISEAVVAIMNHIGGDPSAIPADPEPQASFDWFYFLIFIPLWLASILGRSKSWWAGGVLGVIAGVIIGFIFGFIFTGITAIVGLAIIGLIFDFIVSKAYHSSLSHHSRPPWWTGGGGFGGGGFGGFGGGRSGGGGASGGW